MCRVKAYPRSFIGWFWSVLALLTLTGIALIPGVLALRFELDVAETWLPGSRSLWAALHGLAAFCTLLLLGSLLPLHVRHGLGQRKNRRTGISMLVTLPLLILTGWGVYYIANEYLARWTSAAHVLIALPASLLLGWHVWRAHRIHEEFHSRHVR
jgi:phosphoglycerol transferase MdoB-like AlkP superfamily enzyme